MGLTEALPRCLAFLAQPDAEQHRDETGDLRWREVLTKRQPTQKRGGDGAKEPERRR